MTGSVRSVDLPARARLIDCQVWCWWRDTHAPIGNLVVQAGFVRTVAPQSATGATHREAYVRVLDDDHTIIIWDFGVFIAQDTAMGFVWLRHRGVPRICGRAFQMRNVWSAEQCPFGRAAQSPAETRAMSMIIVRFADWAAEYEAWIRSKCGPAWRTDCWSRAPERKRRRDPDLAGSLVEQWTAVRDDELLLLGR